MDLTDQPIIKHSYDFDPETGLVTIALSDGDDNPIDTIIIERSRHRALMEALQEIARVYSPDIESNTFQGHSTRLRLNEFNATTEFG